VPLYRVTKRTLDFGIGGGPADWVRIVEAPNANAVQKIVDPYPEAFLIQVREVRGMSLEDFKEFMRIREGGGSPTDGEWWDQR
jgi:hypothetical protein